MMDTLGQGISSFIERLSSLRRLKMHLYNRKVSFWDLNVCSLQKGLFYILCPLSEVPLYTCFGVGSTTDIVKWLAMYTFRLFHLGNRFPERLVGKD